MTVVSAGPADVRSQTPARVPVAATVAPSPAPPAPRAPRAPRPQRPVSHHARITAAADAWVSRGSSRPLAARLAQFARLGAYVGGGLLAVAFSEGLATLGDVGAWWDEPIVLQKLAVWTLLWQLLGLGRGHAPRGAGALPDVAGLSYWLTPGTTRLPAWPGRVPFTSGSRRSVVDVGLYAAVLAVAAGLLGLTGADADTLPSTGVLLLLATLALLGLRDRTPLLAARPELHLPLLVAFVVGAGHPDAAVVAVKIALVVACWTTAAVRTSRHFPFAVATALSDVPWLRAERVRRLVWQRDDHDLAPGEVARWIAGSLVGFGIVAPIVLFAASGGVLTVATVTLAVAVQFACAAALARSGQFETTAFVAVATVVAFGVWAPAGFGTVDSAGPVVLFGLAGIVAGVVAAAAPEHTGLLSAARARAGNGPLSVWLFRPDVARQLCGDPSDRLTADGFPTDGRPADGRTAVDRDHDEDLALLGLHPNGRALDGLLVRAVDRPADYVMRSGEFVAGAAVGWCPSGGYGADRILLSAVAQRGELVDGDLRVITLESQATQRAEQRYRIMDAVTGLLEEGLVEIDDMIDRVPWRDPAFPAIPVDVELSVDGRTGYHSTAGFDHLSRCDTEPIRIAQPVTRTASPRTASPRPTLATALDAPALATPVLGATALGVPALGVPVAALPIPPGRHPRPASPAREPRPLATRRPRPVTTRQPRPDVGRHRRPEVGRHPRPAVVRHPRPATVRHPRPALARHPGPAVARHARPAARHPRPALVPPPRAPLALPAPSGPRPGPRPVPSTRPAPAAGRQRPVPARARTSAARHPAGPSARPPAVPSVRPPR